MNRKAALGFSLKIAMEVAPIIAAMHWQLVTPSNQSFFVTGDSPVVPFTLFPDGRARIGAGFMDPDTEVTFPVSPERCLLMSWRRNPGRRRAAKPVIWDINRRTVISAARYVYSSIGCKPVEDLVGDAKWTIGKDRLDKKVIKEKVLGKLGQLDGRQ